MDRMALAKALMLITSLAILTACSLRDEETTEPSNEPVINQKPVAIISLPAKEQYIYVDEIISFAGNSSNDPDGNIPLSFQWTFSGATSSLVQSSEANPGDITFPDIGIVTATLIVSDSLGLDSDPVSVLIHVDAIGTNRAPNGTIFHNKGNASTVNLVANETITFTGSATDPDSNLATISYAWDFTGATPPNATGTGPITISYPNIGTYMVTLTVSDEQMSVDLNPPQITVNVTNGLPVFQFLPVLTPDSVNVNANNTRETYNVTVDNNVSVNVVTPDGSWTTPMMRYNKLQLPPVIVAKRGTEMLMNVSNNLTETTTVHWHGFKIPGAQDGGPDIVFDPGSSKTYQFTMQQPAASLWFHPHADGTTATQVYYGLAGAFILTDDITDMLEANKAIPFGDHDIAMLIQDRSFNTADANNQRTLNYQPGGMMGAGMLGDTVLVNGVKMPNLNVDTRQYRFRLFNGSNARTYDFALADNSSFFIVGTDGGLLNKPVNTDHIKLAAGERAEIVIDFSAYNTGTTVTLLSRQFNDGSMGGGMGGGTLRNGAPFDVMNFDVTMQVADDVTLYNSLPANAEINARLLASDATRTRPFEMMTLNTGGGMGGVGGGGGGMRFAINGKTFNIEDLSLPNYIPDEPDVFNNTVEIWNISNTTNMAHPFHAHAIQWQILSRNGVTASGIDLGWKDTVLVRAGENVQFIGRFDPLVNSGLYMYHCHILEHEDNGMMGTFSVVPPL